jgi:hypothetical protein
MSLALWFWLFYVLSLIFGFYVEYEAGKPYPYPRGLSHLLFYVLIGLLGLQAFGGPVK